MQTCYRMDMGLITSAEFRAGAESAIDDFCDPENTHYQRLSEQAAHLVNTGYPAAIHIPTVDFVVSTTLNVLNQPAVENRNSRVVDNRSASAQLVAQSLARMVVENNIVLDFFRNNPAMTKLRMPRDSVDTLTKPAYLCSVSSAPFYDTSVVAKGGMRFLACEGGIQESRQILARSRGLQSIARVDKPGIEDLHDILNTSPSEACFQFAENQDPVKLIYTDSMRRIINAKSNERSGCPARAVTEATESGRSNLMASHWVNIMNYLVPADARL